MDRKDWLYKAGETFVGIYARFNYTVHLEGTLPQNEPYVLLPKHQKLLDIPLEGHFIRRRTSRLANYVMRGFPFPFNKLFEALGGIEVARAKDLKKGKITKEEFEEKNKCAKEKVLNCLEQGEIVVIHPEGTRHYQEMGRIQIKQGSILARILEEQKYRGTIPFIPMGIEYQGREVWVRAGQPIYTDSPNELEMKAASAITKLSNLNCNSKDTK